MRVPAIRFLRSAGVDGCLLLLAGLVTLKAPFGFEEEWAAPIIGGTPIPRHFENFVSSCPVWG